ncbi:MAG TPA: ABC transporter permease [Bacteroidales bacterium]|nr:ABC transporter permease [Bacteroidales bacterium]
MALNIFTLSVRNLRKHKGLSVTNIAGLTIGFTAFIIVSLFVRYEKSWDKHNVNYERIYRAQRHYIKDIHAVDGNNISPHSMGITAKLITDRCPEVENTVVLEEIRSMYLSTNNTRLFFDDTGGFIDPSVFDVFTYHFVEGNMRTALTEPYSIVLSQSLAQKLFNNGSAIGKTLIAEKKYNLKVTGVYADLPLNSHFRPNYLISMSTKEKQDDVHNSMRGAYMTYVLLKPGTDSKLVDTKIFNLYNGYRKDIEDQKVQLCPLLRIHLSFNGNKDYQVIIFLYNLIGVLILLLSAINYINLTTANAAMRAKETVIKKIHGGKKLLISIQFMLESTVLSVIAVVAALLLANYLLIPFNHIVHKDLVLFTPGCIPFILKIVVITVAIGFVSGIYPAFFMVRNNVLNLLKGNVFRKKSEIISFRKLLVGFQFLVSIFLVTTAIYITLQIKYMLNKNLGFDKENIVYTKFQSTNKDGNFEDLRNRLLRHPEIIDATMARHIPFISFGGGTMNWEGSAPDEVINIRDNYVSYDFFKTMGIPIVQGRGFSREFPADVTDKCIINETACKLFGWKNPIGKRLNDNKLEVIGVAKDFHYKDMHNHIEPAIIRLADGKIEGQWSFALRINPNNYVQSMKILNAEFESYFPNDPFEFALLADGFRNEKTFEIYQSINRTIIFFTILTVLLALIGLLGLVSFITQRKTKEIGIRKISGSSTMEIFLLLNKELVALILVASVLAWGFAVLALGNFPGSYKRPFEFWMMLIAVGLVVLVTFAISFYKTIKAARSNPIEALRYE